MRGAGDRDRTGMASLEGWGSTIELRPHAPRRRSGLSVPGASFGVRRERRPRWDPDGRVGCALHHSVHRGVAQLGSALALGARGRGFESRHPDQVECGYGDLVIPLVDPASGGGSDCWYPASCWTGLWWPDAPPAAGGSEHSPRLGSTCCRRWLCRRVPIFPRGVLP